MANKTIRGNGSALDVIKGLDQPKESESKNLRALKIFEKEKLNLKKKYADDEYKYLNELAKKELKFEHQERKKNIKDRWDEEKRHLKDLEKYSTDFATKLGSSLTQNLISVTESLGKMASSTLNSSITGINQYIGSYSNYMSGIEARIQGSGKSFSAMTDLIRQNIGSSQYVSQTKVLQNLSSLVESGIAYNVEQRAFLASVSDKIATTFNVFDSNLAQIIRIQQADSTAARLGLEAQLTQFFNKSFGDTSYLSTMFDTVSASLLGVESQLGRDRSVEFEYTVQKWLGSLSSVGVSESTIQQLAQGINYLGTGNINALSNNTALQNLLVMASQQAGLDYASMLTGGISSNEANRLLQGIITLGQNLAQSSNQVVKAQYANLFGISISDMTSLLNLTAQDLTTISSNMLTYQQAENETSRQLGLIPGRMSLTERINTMFENTMASMGETIASNSGLYATWLLNSLIMGATGGGIEVTIPFAGNLNLNKVIQGGIVGMSALANIGGILSGLSGANNLSLANWGASEQNIKGGGWGFTGITTIGTGRTTSAIQYVGSSSEQAIYESSVLGAAQQTETVTGISGDSSSEMNEHLQNIDSYTGQIYSLLVGIIQGNALNVNITNSAF